MSSSSSSWTTVSRPNGRGRRNTNRSNNHPRGRKTNNRRGPKKHYDVFCKVCFDAGKPEEVFTSHFLRESNAPGARVVCETLLNTVCKYCKEKGHTPNHCQKLKSRKAGAPRPHHHHHHRQHREEETRAVPTEASFPTLTSDGRPAYVRKNTRRHTPPPSARNISGWKDTVAKDAHKVIAPPTFRGRYSPEEEKPHTDYDMPEAVAAPTPQVITETTTPAPLPLRFESPTSTTTEEVPKTVSFAPEPTPKKTKKVVAAAVDSFW